MKAVHFTLFLHLLALMTGLAGLLIFYPHPELWNGDPTGREVYNFGMLYAGSLHMVFGALTMLFFGLFYVGRRKTLSFFVASCLISLSMELLGTGTGFPFGAYSYTGFLGYKIAGHVPYSIPLSWFYMGFSSFLLEGCHCRLHRDTCQAFHDLFGLASSLAFVRMDYACSWESREAWGPHLLGF